jgi:hypothetical protein
MASLASDGSIVFAPPRDYHSELTPSAPGAMAMAAPTLQRQAGGESPAAPPSGPAAEPATGTPASAPGGAAGGQTNEQLEELAKNLYDKIRERLRAELRLDRERSGRLTELSR